MSDLLPEPEALLPLEPEELAGVVLQCLKSEGEQSGLLNRYTFTLESNLTAYPQEHREQVARALTEAWIWLEREGLIAPRPGTRDGWVFITRRGMLVASPEKLAAYRRANLLPKQQLHPFLAQKVWATFLRGDYDTAVFQAFREVEVCVRAAAQLAEHLIGTDLMRRAFDPAGGQLSAQGVPKAEKEALAHLFAGAIGSYKNPSSHRHVAIEAEEAVEMIMLASHLLKIVDSRTKGGKVGV